MTATLHASHPAHTAMQQFRTSERGAGMTWSTAVLQIVDRTLDPHGVDVNNWRRSRTTSSA